MRQLAPGQMFAGRYQIVAPIGAGGMGLVYRARHLGLDKDVALKLLGNRGSRDFELRFAREARAIARLDHPGCVRVLDHGHSPGGMPYLAMELLEGVTLAAALSAVALTPARAVRLADQLLGALAHAHARGVLHRDVKPENVMLEPTGRTVLIDFGLAALRDEPSVTGAGQCLGSPSYIAPERLRGEPYDARADLYAVGVILYEMLAGVRPFVGASPEAIMRDALMRPAPPLRARRSDLSVALDAVVRRALAKDPDRRFASAEDMRYALADAAIVIDQHEREPETLRREVAARAEQTTTARIAVDLVRGGSSASDPWLRPRRPAWRRALARCWSWLRYGRWRWTEVSRG